MDVDYMFILATATFAFGLSLATYRWFALYNGWPMGEWQAHRPGLPIAIGIFAILFAMLFALARGGPTILILPVLGVLCALTWTAITRVGAQSALLFAPAAMIGLLSLWYMAATQLEPRARTYIDDSARPSVDDRARSAAPTTTVPIGDDRLRPFGAPSTGGASPDRETRSPLPTQPFTPPTQR